MCADRDIRFVQVINGKIAGQAVYYTYTMVNEIDEETNDLMFIKSFTFEEGDEKNIIPPSELCDVVGMMGLEIEGHEAHPVGSLNQCEWCEKDEMFGFVLPCGHAYCGECLGSIHHSFAEFASEGYTGAFCMVCNVEYTWSDLCWHNQ